MKIKFPDTLITVIALRNNRYVKVFVPYIQYSLSDKDYVLVEKGEKFLVESDDFLSGYFNLFTFDKEYVGRGYNDGYDFITLENWREKQIKSVLE